MYDEFSADYDRFVNWPGRLSFEMPLIEACLQPLAAGLGRPLRILDAATGTGMHVIELARRGYQASGADLSSRMIERARANAASAGVQAVFEAAGFGGLREAFFKDPQAPLFDAVLCLGNSLPHLLGPDEIRPALEDFAACLRPGGLALIQNRNFDAVSARQERWMEPQSHRAGDAEWLFVRFYDFRPDGLINFNILTLQRSGQEGWQQKVDTTRLYPLKGQELADLLEKSGFEEVACLGSMAGEAFDPASSGNLVVTARKAGS